MNVSNLSNENDKREIVVDRLLDALKVANFDRNRGIAGFYFVISQGGTIADVTGLESDNLPNGHPYKDSYATLRFKVQDGSTGATGTGPNTGFSTSSGVLEIGDWFIIESVSGLGTEASPFIFTVAVVNNTYELATTALNGIVRLSSRTTYAGLTGNNVVTEGVLKTTVDNAGFAVASNYLPLTGGNITGNLNVSENVGIGTTSPDVFSRFHGRILGISTSSGNSFIGINGASGSNGGVEMGAGGTRTGIISSNATTMELGSVTNIPLSMVTNGSTKMTITGDGNIGIGTTSPAKKLDVKGDIAISVNSKLGAGLNFGDNTQTHTGTIELYNNSSGNTTINNTGFNLDLQTNSLSRLFINNTGNIGIGTTSPATKLHISQNTNSIANILTLNNGNDDTGAIGSSILFSGFYNNAKISAFGIPASSFGGNLIFETNNTSNSLTERMRIDSSGNVGIGTTSPDAKLDVKGNTARFDGSGGGELDMNFTTTNTGSIRLKFGGTTTPDKGRIVYSDNGDSFGFFTNSTERVRVASDGNVGIGETSPSGQLEVKSGATTKTPLVVNTLASQTADLQIWAVNGVISAKVEADGDLYNTNGTYGTISDVRVKENIVEARDYTQDIMKLRVVKYSLKKDNETKPTKIGFIAQEVEKVFPNMIETTKNEEFEDLKQIKTSVLIPMLVKTIQELNKRIGDLEKKIV
jgi:hypothetical protein